MNTVPETGAMSSFCPRTGGGGAAAWVAGRELLAVSFAYPPAASPRAVQVARLLKHLKVKTSLVCADHGGNDRVDPTLAAGAEAPLCVSAADTVFTRGDLARICSEWLASGAPAGLAVRTGGGAGKTPVRVEDGRVVEIGGERGDRTAAPVWFLSESVLPALDGLEGPPYELASAFRSGQAAGVEILALHVGPTRDLTGPEDVVIKNFPYLLRGV
jgi:hypothetical protein